MLKITTKEYLYYVIDVEFLDRKSLVKQNYHEQLMNISSCVIRRSSGEVIKCVDKLTTIMDKFYGV